MSNNRTGYSGYSEKNVAESLNTCAHIYTYMLNIKIQSASDYLRLKNGATDEALLCTVRLKK